MHHSRFLSPATWLLFAVGSLLACGEETTEIEPPPLSLPNEPTPSLDDGHWSTDQRGIALDREDLFAIDDRTTVGLSPDAIRDSFGRLVLNLPYLQSLREGCVPPGEVPMSTPRPSANLFIEELEQKTGLMFEEIAVNVDLLTPARNGIQHACFTIGNSAPRFDVAEYRDGVIAAFEQLADLPNIAWITVGLEMNRYFHFQGGSLADDYTNWVTLYRDVYAAVKARNPDVKVGPGLSWSWFMARDVPAVGRELGIEYQTSMEVFFRAWQRTIEPLLVRRTFAGGRVETQAVADFVGFSIIPLATDAPFRDDPAPADEAARAEVEAYYRRMSVAANGLPVVFPQIDWPVSVVAAGLANKKGSFLQTVKRDTSHVDVAWAAWRRFADLATMPVTTAPCRSYESAGHPDDYCIAGLVDEQGRHRSTLEIFLTNP